MTLDDATRAFLSKIDVPNVEPGTCWPWRGSVNSRTGYGQAWWGGTVRPAHRVSVMLADGDWPAPGTVVRHLCGRRDCVRPAHLRVGSHKENSADQAAHRAQGIMPWAAGPVSYKREPSWVRRRTDSASIGPGSCGRLPAACGEAVDNRCLSTACVWSAVGRG